MGRTVTLGVRSDDVHVSTNGSVTLTAAGMTFDGAKPARELRSAAGSIATHDHELTEGADVTVQLARWHLFDLDGRLICTGH